MEGSLDVCFGAVFDDTICGGGAIGGWLLAAVPVAPPMTERDDSMSVVRTWWNSALSNMGNILTHWVSGLYDPFGSANPRR